MDSRNISSGRATLAKIADEASVSMSTVSKVLNGRPGVSEPVRARIEGLLATSGYQRRADENSRSSFIELVFAGTDNILSGWSLALIGGVDRVCRANGLSVLLTMSGDHHSPAQDWIRDAIARNPAGVILVSSVLSDDSKLRLRTRGIPVVLVDPAGDPAPDVASIGSGNWSGALVATQHLIGLGHERIGLITGSADVMSSQARVSGYRAALTKAGIEFDPALVIAGDYQYSDGVEGGTRLLSAADPPTAIFAANDQQAFGIYEAARSLGLSIPGDVSVVGFDDIPPAQWMSPQLTTVHQPLAEMAEQATRFILAMHGDADPSTMRVELATSLIVRGSTAPPAIAKHADRAASGTGSHRT
ncbi:MAG: LacI family DNA-binding transcriptional regulator [Actinomycetota bacterium]|nr:LacI family DNA-binding transcriptional regulator [Actinomycetota bacterium]